jgi:hypothetical protein
MRISRRDWLRLGAAGVLGASASGWFATFANAAAPQPTRKRACILLWMSGGPSQIDTFDLKPDHANGGEFKEIATAVPGVKISEHLPKIAKFTDKMAILRSLSSKEGDHGRAAHLFHTGHLPGGGVAYPTLGSLISKELAPKHLDLPAFVSIAPYRLFSPAAFSAGFLGPAHEPLVVGEAGFSNVGAFPVGDPPYAESLKVKDLAPPADIKPEEMAKRLELLGDLEADFAKSRPDSVPASHKSAYARAVSLMRTEARKAFDLDQEKATVRDRYGRNLFGQGCLLARRLVEQGVPFVEVSLGGNDGSGFAWDTHSNNFATVKSLSQTLDAGWSALMSDLKERGLLDSTLILWMGEFGRTPKLNSGRGRDHWPDVSSVVLAGGGIKGGQAVGKTSADGMSITEGKASVPDLMATLASVLGIDPEMQHISNGRPIRLAKKGAKVIKEIVG